MAGLPGSHYEILGIDPRAPLEQVERAYRFCIDMYGDGALATYSLLAPDEMRAARASIQNAYEVLIDPGRRLEYDISLGLATPGAPVLPFPSAVPESAAALAPRTPPPVPPSLTGHVRGADLKRFREESGVSLRTIAAASKIGVRFLEYIEADRYDQLPAPVYLRSFLQEYARAVGLDPRRTAEAYMAAVSAQD